MPPRDAILEQALAELTELSRRVADLTATVAALAAVSAGNNGSRDASSAAASIPSEPHPNTETGGPQGSAWSRPQPALSHTPWSPWPLWSMPPMLPPGAWPQHASRPWDLESVATSAAWPAWAAPPSGPGFDSGMHDAGVSALATEPAAAATHTPTPHNSSSDEAPQPVSDNVTLATSDITTPVSDAALPSRDVTLHPSRSRRRATRRSVKKSLTSRAAAETARRRGPPAERASPKKKQVFPKRASQAGSPAAAHHTAGTPHLSATSAGREGRSRRRLGSLLISTSVHALALVVLALVFVTRDAEPEPLMLTSSMSPSEAMEEAPAIEIEPIEPAESMPDLIPQPAFADLAAFEPPPPTLDTLSAADALPTIETVSLLDVGQATSTTTADLLLPFEGSGEGRRDGGSHGNGQAPGMATGGSLFFGTPGAGSSICFMCDNSRSYEEGGFEMVVRELLRSVGTLTEKQSFFVVFFSDEAYPMFYPDVVQELLPATPDNKQRLQLWLTNVEKRTGGQGLRDAISMVESLQPASVCFLSDGDHSESLVERLESAELGDAVVNTFGMQTLSVRRSGVSQEQFWKQQQLNQNLLRIASAHGGVFTPVAMPR